MNKKSIWTNKDGLYVGFGIRGVESNSAARVTANDGASKTIQMKLLGTGLGDTTSVGQLANSVVIPAGSQIELVRITVDTAFTSGGSAVMDIGGYSLADAVDDDDGFVTALAVATLAAGFQADYEAVSGAGGAYIKTILASPLKIGASYDTAAFTAGVATLTIVYSSPAN
jgi:hypothetical protein